MPSAVHKTPGGEEVTVVPANEASWDDLQTVFGPRGDAHKCQCQRYKFRDMDLIWVPREAREAALREQTGCGDPAADTTSGLVAYLGDEPVGWCAVEPRSVYEHLRSSRVVWAGRDEDPEDESVWAAVCFVTRTGFRRRGVSRALAAATVDFARERGARALEAYPIVAKPGEEFSWGELYVGSRNIFAAAGFTEISRPTARRAVMRVDFRPARMGIRVL
jgi:GNAT superfamily N-acetyltransferase